MCSNLGHSLRRITLRVVLVMGCILATCVWMCDGRCQEREEAISLLAAQSQGARLNEDAVTLLGHAIWSCDPSDHEMYMGLGSELYGRGDVRGAHAAFRSALRLAPYSMDHANNVAACLIDMGQAREAVQILTFAERRNGGRNKSTWKTHINLASALAELQRLEASAERLMAALAFPDHFAQRPIAAANLLYTKRQLLRWSDWEQDAAEASQLCKGQLKGSFNHLAPSLPVDPYMALSFSLSPSLLLAIASHAASFLPRPAQVRTPLSPHAPYLLS